ncbi:MAG TPA: hypothetical protein VGQ35_01740 [Dongiaceae bacterium]|nr:hypothetical protein [Dongiaceae bacterium]
MKKQHLIAGLIAAGLAHGFAGAAQADPIQIGVSTNPNSYGVAEIKVDGPTADGVYTEIRNETLDYIVSARGDRPKKATGNGRFEIQVLKDSPLVSAHNAYQYVNGELGEDLRNYKLSMAYVDPWSHTIVNERVSPIEVCNDNLKIRKADERREEMLKKGMSILYQDAYKLRGYVEYPIKAAAFDKDTKWYAEIVTMPVKITCMPLERIRPREKTSTKGAPPRQGKPMPPTISKATFRIEPAQIVQDGKFLCPSQLKLHGYLEAIREFHGQSIFVGPHYLSAITKLDFQAEGSRNVTATYKMDWHQMGGLAAQPNAEPKKQKLTFHFNIANKDGKLLKSVEETVDVSCKKIKVNAPTVGDEMTVKPAN